MMHVLMLLEMMLNIVMWSRKQLCSSGGRNMQN